MKRGESGISCLVGIDKPTGPTSHDVVGVIRRSLGERRVGHAGTLDPLASGVMVMGVGQATRLLGLLTLDDKEYEADIVFGSETSTDDAEGEVLRTLEPPSCLRDEGYARQALSRLVGEWDQVPPAYSAISVDGKRAYARARAGEELQLESRRIEIFAANLVAVVADDDVRWVVRLRVSKGTYIRSVARDLGRELGCAAHLGALRRLSSGTVDIESCVSLDDLAEVGPALLLARCLDPSACLALPVRHLEAFELEDVLCGRKIGIGRVEGSADDGLLGEGERVSLVHEDRLFGIWRRSAGMLVSVATFPQGVCGVRS